MNKQLISALFPVFFLWGCSLFESHPYDGHITGERNINNKNIEKITEATRDKEMIRFAFMGDSQGWYDEAQLFVKAINQRDDIDFVLHGGDISDFGATREFLWQRDIFNNLNVPYVVILGNHDCLGNGKEVFNKVFGEENFTFTANFLKFVCLNTNAMEYDYSHPVPDFEFIEEALSDDNEKYSKTIVAMHARPGSEQFNNNVKSPFQYFITQLRDLQFCLNAHDHNLQVEDIFGDGIIYYGCESIQKRSYLLFTVYKEKEYEYEVVRF